MDTPAPISLRLATPAQLAAVDAFAQRHNTSRNAALNMLISFGLQRERQVMAHHIREYGQRLGARS